MEELQFGKYTATRKLGEGAMGEVYYGIHPNLDIPIAIKTLSAKVVDDTTYIERFIKEAKIAAKIKHENAVMIYDADKHEGTYFIVMEYVSGGDLKSTLAEKNILEEKEALSITRAVAAALNAAAPYDIIHRDIKPSNIMMDENGVPKLADLGIAKNNSDENDTTITGAIIGTPNYLAPEQAQDSRKVDARTDIYSLGCTLFHMLAGHAPFKGDNALGVLMKHATDPIPDLTKINKNVSPKTWSLVQRMMAKDPAKRPQSAENLVQELDILLLPKEQEIQLSKNKAWLTLSLVGAVVVLALIIAFFPGEKDKGNEKVQAKNNNRVEVVDKTSNTTDQVEEAPEVIKPFSENDFKISGIEVEMIYLEPGSFQMGAQLGEPNSQADETLHRVSITEGFFLSKYEVNVKAWKQFVEETDYKTTAEKEGGAAFRDEQGKFQMFVEGTNWKTINLQDNDVISVVSRTDCIEFCKWLTYRDKKEKRIPGEWEYTLPTEAQWEYACRAGSSSTYANDMTLGELGFYIENSNASVQRPGLRKPNKWGLYDMHGNVWEHCLDASEGSPFWNVTTNTYRDGTIDPLSKEGNLFVQRGGSYIDSAEHCRAAFRIHAKANYAANNHGFRLCLSKIRSN